MKRFLLPLGLFVALLGFLAVGLQRDPREIPSPFIGKTAPPFKVAELMDPQRLVAPADMQNKVWLLNVWASWCSSCRQEHPVLMEFAQQNVVPIVGLDYKDVRADGINWLQQYGNPYQYSAFDADGRIGIDYGVYGVPETFVIDKHGVIRLKHVGPITPEVIAQKLIPLIKELNRA